MKVELDHIGISDIDRALISRAVNHSARVYLAPMDKGLSGSNVWQARWLLEDNNPSKLSVFKIGPAQKITKEYEAMAHVATAVGDMPAFLKYVDAKHDRALLLLQFQGSTTPGNEAFSLRNYVRRPIYHSTPDTVCQVIDRLYCERMQSWHYVSRNLTTRNRTIGAEVPRWKSKIDLERAAAEIGLNALNADLMRTHGVTVGDLAKNVETILNDKREMRWGPIHGDLHAANVNLDESLNVYLIDYGDTRFGWRALDFIILEAAIKFAAAPNHAPISALLECERSIDVSDANGLSYDNLLYGDGLQKVSMAARAIRRHCLASGAEAQFANYRAGLICVAAAFTSIEWLVNRRFLFHSIAYQCKVLNGAGA
jgi:hypothetical protein